MSEEGEEAAGGFRLRRGKTSPPMSCACAVALPYEPTGVAAIHLTLVVARVRTVRRGSPHKGSPVFLRRAPERNTTTPKGLRRPPEETAKTLRGHRLKGSVEVPSRWEEESFRTLQQGVPKRAHGRGKDHVRFGDNGRPGCARAFRNAQISGADGSEGLWPATMNPRCLA